MFRHRKRKSTTDYYRLPPKWIITWFLKRKYHWSKWFGKFKFFFKLCRNFFRGINFLFDLFPWNIISLFFFNYRYEWLFQFQMVWITFTQKSKEGMWNKKKNIYLRKIRKNNSIFIWFLIFNLVFLGVQNHPWLIEMSNPEIFWSKMMVLAALQILD